MTSTTPAADSDRLFGGQIGFWRTKLIAGVVLLAGPAMIALGIGGFVTIRPLKVGIAVVGVFLIVLGTLTAAT